MTLLHWACDRGHLNVVELLVTRGADINSQVWSHPHTGRFTSLSLSLFSQDNDKQTPLHYGKIWQISNFLC